jgi:hypothetical protein
VKRSRIYGIFEGHKGILGIFPGLVWLGIRAVRGKAPFRCAFCWKRCPGLWGRAFRPRDALARFDRVFFRVSLLIGADYTEGEHVNMRFLDVLHPMYCNFVQLWIYVCRFMRKWVLRGEVDWPSCGF